jgi:RND superfamily putative drug exporter
MATLLYRLGRTAFRRRRTVLAFWLALLIGVGSAAAAFSEPLSESFSIPGTESQRAVDLLTDRFPEVSANGAAARVVFQAPEGSTLAAAENRAAVEQTLAELQGDPDVAGTLDPYTAQSISPDGRTAYAQVQYGVQAGELEQSQRDQLLEIGDPARDAGLRVEVGGDAVQAPFEQKASELIGVAVAAVVLVITLGSLVAAGLPLVTALLGVALALAGVTAATAVTELSSTAPVLALMLGLAVGIDYALFIVSRYRNELHQGHAEQEAAARALGTAGNAVVFAGATVVIALVGLAVVGIPFLTTMGLVAAAAVVVAVLIALTLLPATLGFAGRRINGRSPGEPWRRSRRAALAATPAEPTTAVSVDRNATVGRRWGAFVVRHRVLALLAPLVALVLMALPAADLELAFPDESAQSPATTQRQAYDLLSDGFGPGFNGPLTVVVEDVAAAGGEAGLGAVVERLQSVEGVQAVGPPTLNTAGDTAVLGVVPTTGPGSPETEELVERLRSAGDLAGDSALAVTGLTAINIDISQKLLDALPVYIAVVIGLALLLLGLVFRSVLVPLTAAAGFLLTIVATLGAVVAVFQWGWGAELLGVAQTGPVISILPILMVAVLFGLAMDYQVFLVTRMREEHIRGQESVTAVVEGFAHGARVVTAAAVIMVSVFAGFILAPEAQIKGLGFAFAFGILLDAFLVRMTIIPAVTALMGRSAWWLPRWLDRLLPDVDVEGEGLRRRLEGAPPAPSPQPVGGH